MRETISACGLDCLNCECRIAYLGGDEARKEEIAQNWSIRYQASLSRADIKCQGCMEGNVHFNWCERCPIRSCVIQKGYQTCAECSAFPCQHNSGLYEQVPAAREAIERIKKEL